MASVYGKMRFVVNKEMINIREIRKPSQAHCVRQLPRRGELLAIWRSALIKLPLRGSWHGVSRD
jgi:hypothetical protein